MRFAFSGDEFSAAPSGTLAPDYLNGRGTTVTVRVNGGEQSLDGWQGRRLLDYLRDGLGLTGAKEGCGEGECGACTVILDGDPVCSCLTLTDTVAGCTVTTVEGLDPELVRWLQARLDAEGGVQCGFCTTGFTVMAQWLRQSPEAARENSVEKLLEGNLCRCTGYVQLLSVFRELVTQAARSAAC